MFSLKKIQLLVVLISLTFLSFVKQTGMTEMPSLAKNSNISDMSSTRNMSTEREVGSCVFIIYIFIWKSVVLHAIKLALALRSCDFVIKRLMSEYIRSILIRMANLCWVSEDIYSGNATDLKLFIINYYSMLRQQASPHTNSMRLHDSYFLDFLK